MPINSDSTSFRQCIQCGNSKPATHEHFPISKTGLLQPGKPCRACIKDLRRQYSREYARKNADKRSAAARKWKKENPEFQIVRNANRNTNAKGLTSVLTVDEWRACLAYFDQRCAVCGKGRDAFTSIALDHWIPVSSPDCTGTHKGNVLPLCHTKNGGSMRCCNQTKQGRDPAIWLVDNFGRDQAGEILSRINAYFDSIKAGITYALPECVEVPKPGIIQLTLF